jgi:dolichyl-phosphate beta-glucosyltransferase
MAKLPHEVSSMTNPASENTAPCFLSIIIPAFNEEKRLPDSLPKIIRFVHQQAYPVEVIVVDDGSSDRTVEVVREFQNDAPFISLLPVEHGGKGHAVRAGMQQARGEYLFLCDSDLSMPIE